jgi:hypothetical protein
MELPNGLDADELLSILILRVLDCSEDETAGTLHCGKIKVVASENWVKLANHNAILTVCDQQAIKRVIARELASCEEIDRQTLIKAAQLTTDDILRYYRPDLANMELPPSPGFDKHLRELAEVAKTLHDVQKCLLSYKDDEIYKVRETYPNSGMWNFYPMPKKQPKLPTFVGSDAEVEYLLCHLLQEFPKLDLKDWEKLVTNKLPKDVVERLRYLGNTARFNYCPTCQICKDLMAERPANTVS